MKDNSKTKNIVISAPVEEIRNIENVIESLQTVHYELKKVVEAMKTINN